VQNFILSFNNDSYRQPRMKHSPRGKCEFAERFPVVYCCDAISCPVGTKSAVTFEGHQSRSVMSYLGASAQLLASVESNAAVTTGDLDLDDMTLTLIT